MSQYERNHSRDLTFNDWHRTVGVSPQTGKSRCWFYDIDGIEIRTPSSVETLTPWYELRSGLKGVAVYEVKARGESLVAWETWQRQVTSSVAEKLGVPGLLIIYDRNEQPANYPHDAIRSFEVHNLLTGACAVLDDRKMREFIIRLPRSARDMLQVSEDEAA
jgi:hypothetical protein